MIRHINPPNGAEATAPYNFVPLPERVYVPPTDPTVENAAGELWRNHDRFRTDMHAGWFDLTIKALTPLYTRGPQRKVGTTWDGKDTRLRAAPFTLPDGRPVIPGSSLRGLTRTLVEIMAFARMGAVPEVRPFYRSVGNDRVGQFYRARVTQNGKSKPRGGILVDSGLEWRIQPCPVLRVPRELLERDGVSFPPGPDYRPSWNYQDHRCYIQTGEPDWKVVAIRVQEMAPVGDWTPGRLVLTGNAPKKKAEFVFLDPTDESPIPVPSDIWQRFHDADQISQWQERAFPKNQPVSNARKSDGWLRNGEPVFFLYDEQQPDRLSFLGRAQMFRFPYDLRPLDLLPPDLWPAELRPKDVPAPEPDMAERIFGTVERRDDGRIVKGRVRFEDAIADDVKGGWLDQEMVPAVLSAPKVTAFAHYLTQDGQQPKDQRTTYLAGDHTTLRGHKWYWHRWDPFGGLDQARHPEEGRLIGGLRRGNTTDKQSTLIQPVRAGVTFRTRIHFDNLTTIELGALVAALQLPAGHAHKIGMGKPLGLGSVRIETVLRLVDRPARYRSWNDLGMTDGDATVPLAAFTNAMLAHARATRELTFANGDGLWRIARLDALRLLLRWDGRPPLDETRGMTIGRGARSNEFAERNVLPTPHGVLGAPEPSWQIDPPRPAPPPPIGQPGPARSAPTPTAIPQPAAPMIPTQRGDRQTWVALAETTKTGKPLFRLKGGDLLGHLDDGSETPPGLTPGKEIDLYLWTPDKKRVGLRWSMPDPPAKGHGMTKRPPESRRT